MLNRLTRAVAGASKETPKNVWDTKNMKIGDTLTQEYGDVPKQPVKGRRAGVVLHPTSLPGPYGAGELGAEAFKFVDFLASASMQIWQVLPLVPPGRPIPGVREDYWSPYSGQDANAGSHLMIDLEGLVEMGVLDASDLPPKCDATSVDWDYLVEVKEPLLFKAAGTLLTDASPSCAALRKEFEEWRSHPDTAAWLDPAALFNAITSTPELVGTDWWTWPAALRDMEEAAMEEVRTTQKKAIDEYCALQWLFDFQWLKVKAYANSKGIALLGDMPIYVGGHSADVWANKSLFTLNKEGISELVSGVPPDAFSDDGQLWGSPLYDWEAHAKEGFAWWTRRLGRATRLYDETRIDHFRGLAGYWAVDAASETAKNGVWKVGPGFELFDALKRNLGEVPIVAEDLGVITPDVIQLREGIDAPGMVVLQFAFDGDGTNIHRPHNHYPNSICYPGTHDNDTAVGWFAAASQDAKDTFSEYSGMTDPKDIAWHMIRMGMASVSSSCIMCMQDILSLDGSNRMNTPGVADGNWVWRCKGFDGLEDEARKLTLLCDIFDRLPPEDEEDVAVLTEPSANGVSP